MNHPNHPIILFGICLALVLLSHCTTDPGTATPVGGASVTFTYARGEVRVTVGEGTTALALGTRSAGIVAAAVLFDINSVTGAVQEATQLEEGVSVTWPENLSLTIPGCSLTPTLRSTQVNNTNKIFYYDYPQGCTPSNSVTGTAGLVVSKIGYPDKTLNGTSDSVGTYHTVFVTSTTYNGNLGSLSGADSKCATRAAAGSVTGGLTGTWRAILSTSTTDAVNRITFTGGAGLKNTIGSSAVATASSLWSGTLQNAIKYDENGSLVSSLVDVWTGSKADGTHVSQADIDTDTSTCDDWGVSGQDGYVGNLNSTTAAWIYTGSINGCFASGLAHLYCVNSVN